MKKTGLKAFLQWASDQVARNRMHDVPATLPTDNLSKALNLLPEGQRTVLILRVISGLRFKQISSIVGIKMNTTASRYRYACLLYTSPSPRDVEESRMPSSA